MCKINVNFSRKVSDNNYGFFVAGVSFEFEVDTAKNINAEQLQDRIRKAFRLAQKAVSEELASAGPPLPPTPALPTAAARLRRGPGKSPSACRASPSPARPSPATPPRRAALARS